MANGYVPGGLDEEELRKFLEGQMSKGYGSEEAAISKQKRKAKLLRGMTDMPQGQMVGNQYVASNPLEFLAPMLAQYQAGKAETGIDTATADLASMRQTDRAQTMAGIQDYQGMEGADQGALSSMLSASEDPRYAAMGGKMAGQQFQTGEREARDAAALEVRGEKRTYDADLLRASQGRADEGKLADRAHSIAMQDDRQAEAREIAELKSTTDDKLTPNKLASETVKFRDQVKTVDSYMERFAIIDKTMSEYAVGGEREGENLPGMGWLEGKQGAFGSGYRTLRDTFGSTGGRSADVAAGIAAIANDIIHDFAGSAVTKGEMARVLKRLSSGFYDTEEATMRAFDQVREAMNHEMESLQRGTPQQIKDKYGEGWDEGANPLDRRIEQVDYGQYADQKVKTRSEKRSKRPGGSLAVETAKRMKELDEEERQLREILAQ